ncbi:MAG: ABC transporter substrate-binding protein [Caldilineaceae bacterium]
MMISKVRFYPLLLSLFLLAVLAACVAPAAPTASSAPAPAPAADNNSSQAGTLNTTYPLTISDCSGHTTTYNEAPQTPVTLDPQSYEMMFWLGLGQKQIAAGPQPLPAVPDQFKEQTSTVTTLARAEGADYVSKEVLLAAKPDFVYGAYRSGFNGDTMFSEEEWAAKGVNSYLSFSGGGCKGEDASAPRVNLNKTFLDIKNLGKIFDIQDQANALIARMKSDLETALKSVGDGEKLRVGMFEPGEYYDERPGVMGATSTTNAIITLAGGVNAFGDIEDAYQQTTWEEYIKRDPQVIIVIAYPAAAPQAWIDGEKLLSEMPALQNVSAIKDRRFVRLTFPEMGFGGVRNVDAVKKLAEALAGK